LWTVLVIAAFLLVTDVSYPTYFSGAQFIHFLLGPAVVALGWPLWQRRAELRARWLPLLVAALIGGAAAAGSAWALGIAFKLPGDVVLSMVTKSVTAPVAMGVAEKIGGIPALAAVFAVLTGIVGALSGKYLFDLFRIDTSPNGWMARGYALGTASHGIGAARALQVNDDAGAYAGLALGLQVVLASLLIPMVFRLL
jgi:putative effector of murein hydrolase